MPIILGQSFLPIGRILVDVESGSLQFRINDEEVSFNIDKVLRRPDDFQVNTTIEVVDEAVQDLLELSY